MIQSLKLCVNLVHYTGNIVYVPRAVYEFLDKNFQPQKYHHGRTYIVSDRFYTFERVKSV